MVDTSSVFTIFFGQQRNDNYNVQKTYKCINATHNKVIHVNIIFSARSDFQSRGRHIEIGLYYYSGGVNGVNQ